MKSYSPLISFLALMISAVWLFAAFVLSNSTILVGLNLVLLAIGITSLIFAARRRYPWRMAALIAITPLLQLLGAPYITFGIGFVLVYVVPIVLVLTFASAQLLQNFKRQANSPH